MVKCWGQKVRYQGHVVTYGHVTWDCRLAWHISVCCQPDYAWAEFEFSALLPESEVCLVSVRTARSMQKIQDVLWKLLQWLWLISVQCSVLCKSCYSHIHEFCCDRPYFDFSTARTVASFAIHSKLDRCNSLYYSVPESQVIFSLFRILLLML